MSRDSVVANFATTAADGKNYQVEYFNLDVIISVGYRVNSRQGTQFRIWANKILKDYLTKGYAIDEKRFKEQSRQLEELKKTVRLLGNVIENKAALNSDEATGLLRVVTDYAYALDVLDRYDHQVLEGRGQPDQFEELIGATALLLQLRRNKILHDRLADQRRSQRPLRQDEVVETKCIEISA